MKLKKQFHLRIGYLPGLLPSFFILLLLILALWLISFFYFSDATKEDAISTSQQLLRQGEQRLDDQLTSVRQYTLSLLMYKTETSV